MIGLHRIDHRKLLPLVIGMLGLFSTQVVFAYDGDVDYSAPYLTLQDGKLVTVDPSRQDAKQQGQHPAQPPVEGSQAAAPETAAGTAAATSGSSSGSEPATGRDPVWLYAVLIAAVLLPALVLIQRRRRTDRQERAPAEAGYSGEKG